MEITFKCCEITFECCAAFDGYDNKPSIKDHEHRGSKPNLQVGERGGKHKDENFHITDR